MAGLSVENLDRLKSLIDALEGGDDSAAPQIFSIIDLNGNGRIEAVELRTVMSQALGENLTEADVNEMILAADTNKNGVIELNEFVDSMKNKRGA